MNFPKISRREAMGRTLQVAGAMTLGQMMGPVSARAASPEKTGAFRFCLNTATLRGQKLGIVKEVQIAAEAGYDSIEPWVNSIEDYVKAGGSLADLKKQISDAGLTVESAIAFAEWIVDNGPRREKGLERAKREMDMVAQIGGKRFAAPPTGATDLPKLDLLKAADRYRALLDAAEPFNLVPQLELWGFSKNLNRLGECVDVAIETGHQKACVLADVYHLYKGGSDVNGIALLGPTAIQVLHMNDYPAEPRETIEDSFRVHPGDGIAPITKILSLLRQCGGQKVLSLELFNRKYWTEDPLSVAKAGLAKMKNVAGQV